MNISSFYVGFLSILLLMPEWDSTTYAVDSDAKVSLGKQINFLELSGDEKRLQVHLNIYNEKIGWKDVNELYQSATNIPIDVRFSALLQDAKSDRKSFVKLRKLAQANINSPSISSRYLEFLQAESHGSVKYGGSNRILTIEPFWIPELLRKLSNDSSAWLAMARYGVTILDLVEIDSDVANRTLLLNPAYRIARKYTGKARCAVVLAAFRHNAKIENWHKNYPSDERRLEAVLLYHTGSTNESRVCYEKMIKNGIARASSYYRLARIYEAQGKCDKAEDTIQAGLNKFPEKNSVLLVAAAEHAINNNNTEDALRILHKCLAESPEYPPANILLAEIEAKLHDRNAAIKACADVAAYCYGWGGDYRKRIAEVLKKLAVEKRCLKKVGNEKTNL